LLICVDAQILGLVSTDNPLHGPRHDHDDLHAHSHGLVDSSILRSNAGVKAVTASLAVLLVASAVQLLVFLASGSVALLTDVIHNGGDALTAVPLGIAFLMRNRRAERDRLAVVRPYRTWLGAGAGGVRLRS